MNRHTWPTAILLALSCVGCSQPNASHCANRDGDQTCEQQYPDRRVCNSCVAENDGCVASISAVDEARCHSETAADTVAETSTQTMTSLDTTATTVGTTASSTESSSSETVSGTVSTSGSPTTDAETTMASVDETTSATTGVSSESTASSLSSDSSTGEESTCPNGTIDMGEECDGDDLDGLDCASFGFPGGTLACTNDCVFDQSMCTPLASCGDGDVDGGEDCDGADLGGAACPDANALFGGGALGCNDNCTFDTSGCCFASLSVCNGATNCCDGDCFLALCP